MEYRVVIGALGAFYVEGIDPKDSACLSSFNTKYSKQTPIMQFTGLKDRYDRDIYEGDIIKGINFSRLDGHAEECRYVIEFVDDASILCMNRLPRSKYIGHQHNEIFKKEATVQFEIIGNIFEHPDLLK
jgi:uncharacterized phage protein (TIGR01671 family)